VARHDVQTGIGKRVCRVEDARFLMGEGRYVDDVSLPNLAYASIVRSPHAHARVIRVDVEAARSAPGVLAVLTGQDTVRDGLGDLRCPSYPTLPPSVGHFRPEQPVLARGKVRHVGDRVALVVAETINQAHDAAELIHVDYEALDPVPSSDLALRPSAPKVWDEAASNLCFPIERGDKAAVDEVFRRASHVTSIHIRYPRASANAMEPRCAIGDYQKHARRYTLYTGTPQPHRSRQFLADTVFRIPEANIRVVTPDVGGGFGMRGTVYPEEVLVLWAARKVGRPVKWVGQRSECLMSDMHGRDQVTMADMALDANGRILALRASTLVNVGAYLVYSAAVPPLNAASTLSGAYDIPLVYADVRAVFTTTNPLGPYRGSGRPETTFLVERLIEKAALEIGLESVELRRRNLIPASAMPYKTAGGSVMDCGDLGLALDKAIMLADFNGFPDRKEESERRGRLRGLGIALHAENAAHLSEKMELSVDSSGSVTIYAGTVSSGQGHETLYAQIVSECLAIPPALIRVQQGDTDKVVFGRGSFAARTAVMAGSALRNAASALIEKAKGIAAWILDAPLADIRFEDGTFSAMGTNRFVSLSEVARRSYAPDGLPIELGIGLHAEGVFSGPQTYPYGCMACEVEVDPDTGAIQIIRFAFVDDVGIAISPLIVEGQTHGSIAQGAGQVLLEDVVFDRDSGQILSSSFLDYCMPRADNFPSFEGAYVVVPTKTNPLGAKGGSETGSFGAPPAVINAVLNALAPLGVTDVNLPATPQRVWKAIQAAKRSASAAAAYS
jgi:aerobic carbon-monoxide dehydrogenase large subunit